MNRAPNVLLILDDEVDEGSSLTIRAEVGDPGDDPVFLEWDLMVMVRQEVFEDTPVVGGISEREITVADDGRFNLSIWATDDEGATQIASTSLIVRNVAPQLFAGYTPLPAKEGEQYASVIPVSDPAGSNDPLTYQLVAGPPNIDLDPVTGLLLWTPTYDEYLQSPTRLSVRVSDGDGGVLEVNLEINVLPRDDDEDGLPDTYESRTCDDQGACLDPTDPNDGDSDLDQDGLTNLEEWTEGSDPFVYDGPDQPILLSPLNGGRVNTATPNLEVEIEPYDGARDAWVRIELYTDEGAMNLLGSERMLIDERTILGWLVDDAMLDEDEEYFLRARAESDVSETEWTDVYRFTVNATNTPPPTPLLLNPSDGATLSEAAPTFMARGVDDTDGDELRCLFRFYRPNGEIETLGYGQLDTGVASFSQPMRGDYAQLGGYRGRRSRAQSELANVVLFLWMRKISHRPHRLLNRRKSKVFSTRIRLR